MYARFDDAALAGVGLAADETCARAAVRVWEAIAVQAKPTREEVADFFETIGQALKVGAGMTQALTMAARVAHTPRMRGVVGELRCRVSRGDDLHTALRQFPETFVPMQVAMVEAASAANLQRAGELLITLADRLQKDGKILRKLVGALAYPATLVLLTLIGTVVLEIWALPPMVELFRTLGGQLPPITRAFYAVAQGLRAESELLEGLAITGVICGIAFGPRVLRARAVQRLSVRLIVVGPIVQWLALVRALGTFVLLKQSGASVRDQFAMAGAAAGNCVVGGFFDACYARICVGESVEEAFTAERHRLGDDGVRLAGKMEVGMAGADLAGLLRRIIAELEDRASVRLELLPNLIRWPLLILCCGMIGTVALAIVLPYPNLIADVAHAHAETAAPR